MPCAEPAGTVVPTRRSFDYARGLAPLRMTAQRRRTEAEQKSRRGKAQPARRDEGREICPARSSPRSRTNPRFPIIDLDDRTVFTFYSLAPPSGVRPSSVGQRIPPTPPFRVPPHLPRRPPTARGAAACCLALTFAAVARVRAVSPDVTPPPPIEATTLFNNAVTAFGNGNYQDAITNIESLIRQIPPGLPPADQARLNAQLEPVFFTLGAAHFNLKQFPEAIKAIKDYLVRYPKSTRAAEATFSLAQASYFSKDYETAAAGFAALERNPAFREQALLLEGLSYREGGREGKAIPPLERLTAAGIKSPTARRGAMQLVSLYSQGEAAREGVQDLALQRATRTSNRWKTSLNSTSVALEQGDNYLQNNQNKEALTCYRGRPHPRAGHRHRARPHRRVAKASGSQQGRRPRRPESRLCRYFTANKQLQDSIAEDQKLVDTLREAAHDLPEGALPHRPRVLRRWAVRGNPSSPIRIATTVRRTPPTANRPSSASSRPTRT